MTLYRATAELVRADSTGRTIYGLAVPYGQTAEVDDGFGPYREQFEYGAFTRSIAERGHKVRLFAVHQTRKLPIGRATELREASDGLHAAFTVARTRDGDEALELVTSGIADGLSVGFDGIRERRSPDGVIVRTEAALREVSLCAEGAYPGAVVAGVRSAHPPLSTDLAARRLRLILEMFE
jgi:HK97 family phage prohead protease